LILANNKPPPTKRNPRLRPARNNPLNVSTLVFRACRQATKAMIPVNNRKLPIVTRFVTYNVFLLQSTIGMVSLTTSLLITNSPAFLPIREKSAE
jgi:hypothetical protein